MPNKVYIYILVVIFLALNLGAKSRPIRKMIGTPHLGLVALGFARGGLHSSSGECHSLAMCHCCHRTKLNLLLQSPAVLSPPCALEALLMSGALLASALICKMRASEEPL